MTNKLIKLIRGHEPLDPAPADVAAWDKAAQDANLDEEIAAAISNEYAPKPKLAAEAAADFLRNGLSKLAEEEKTYSEQLAEISERLHQVRLTTKAFHAALSTIEEDEKLRHAKMPQAVDFTGVAG